MRLVIQRVHQGYVSISEHIIAKIGIGFVVLVGFGIRDDTMLPYTSSWSTFINKLATLRIFPDKEGKMFSSLEDINGEILLIPQFTLYGDCYKGRRPSFHLSATPSIAKDLFMKFFEQLSIRLPNKIQHGIFGANMDVGLVNWGPVTMLLDSETYR